MATTRLEDVERLNRHQTRLQALGYRNVESFLAAACIARDEMSAYLGEDVEAVIRDLSPEYQAHASTLAPVTGFLPGATLAKIPRHDHAYDVPVPAVHEPLACKINLISQMPPIRTQGNRCTCVPHSAIAVFEHSMIVKNKYRDMSEQFLYWSSKQNDGTPEEAGTSLAVAVALMARDGCCFETTWPYVSEPVEGNESQKLPPTGAAAEALLHKGMHFHHLPPTSVEDLKSELHHQRPVAFDVPVFNSWVQSSEVARTGELTLPIPGEQAAWGHAMCLVGYEDIPEDRVLGGGKFILRNSWGAAWATESAYQPGYGTIPYAYIARHGMEAYSLAESEA